MAEPDSAPQTPPSRRLGCGASVVLVVLVLCLFGGFALYRVEKVTGLAISTGSADLHALARNVRNAFNAVIQVQPQVSVNEEVIYTQTNPVLELAVVSEQVVVEREVSTSWLGSTKRLRLRGVYNVKAGYDLREPFTVQMDSAKPGKVLAAVPPAKILGVEQEKLDVLTLENGIWNRLSASDLTNEVNELNLDARAKARRGGILERTQESLINQVKGKLGSGYDLQTSVVAGEAIDPSPSPAAK